MALTNEIKMLKNNSYKNRENWDSCDWLEEFKRFLTGTENPEGMHIGRGHQPNLSAKKAMAVIWYLQEHLAVFPDTIEECTNCGRLFDCNSEGLYWESKGKHWCGSCDYLVPLNYDNNQRN